MLENFVCKGNGCSLRATCPLSKEVKPINELSQLFEMPTSNTGSEIRYGCMIYELVTKKKARRK